MANYLDETGLQTLRTRIEAVYRRRDDMIGTVMWWSGSISSIPSNAKICNGQSLSSTTYATLYARIGTTYGGDSTNFALPDLRTSSDYGRFVRARFKDIGSGSGQIPLADITQEDAIRNITGIIETGSIGGAYPPNNDFIHRGSFSYLNTQTTIYKERGQGNYYFRSSSSGINYGYAAYNHRYPIAFDANQNSESYGNTMAGHADASDSDGGIRPSNISLIPIIIVS